MHRKISLLIAALLIPLVISGCGGPKYSKDLKEKLGQNFASNYPLKLESVKIEQVSEGSAASVAIFHADLSVTEDLYAPVTDTNRSRVEPTISRMQQANVPIGDQQALEQTIPAIVPILKVVTPQGRKITSSGKVRAMLKDDGTWEYHFLDEPSVTLEGIKAPSGKWYSEGSPEAKAYLAEVNSKVSDFMVSADKAIQAAQDVRKKEEEQAAEAQARVDAENKRRVEAFFADCASGKVMNGFWQSTEAKGNIGIRFGENEKFADGYSFQGVLFDPNDPSHTKPFTGMAKGKGTPQDPFKLELAVTSGSGIITGRLFAERWIHPQGVAQYGTIPAAS